MDGGVSTAAIEVLIQNLINVLKEEYSLLRGLGGDAQQLWRTLSMIQTYLAGAEKKPMKEKAVRFWLRELEAMAFDAEDILDELSYHLLHKKVKKMETPKVKDNVQSCFSSFNRISRRRNMARIIKQINADFESMNKRAADLGLQTMVVNAPAAATHTSSETDSLSLDPIIMGRDVDLHKLIKMLHQDGPEERIFSIVALVGMGGIGKTTLTREVFNHESVRYRFESHIWVHVSQIFDPIILFNKIFSTLTSHTGDGVESREVILRELQEALRNKKYLLVLDDVWNENIWVWEDFINSMSRVTSTKGNGIIITTRNTEVATIVKPFHIHHLNGLSDEDCWSIIKAKTFHENGKVPSGFEMIGRKIAKRCQGLPLAAYVVGGVLWSKSEEEWRFINENWLSGREEGEDILKILKLSFDNLPSPSVKNCFAYCSIFPEGRIIMKQELIELWMAEGFLEYNQRDDMESVGNMFFNVLLHNSLLLVAERDDYGNIRSCVMHNLVHDLASSVLSNNADGSTPVRYMFLEEKSIPIPKEVAKRMRALFLEGGTSGTMLMFSNFQCLHSLTLYGDNYKELPNSIRKLIHLRNLNISNTSIENLPKWIGELHRLQTLRAETLSLKKLPSTLKYLIELRHLYITRDTELPWEIGRLTSLQKLSHFTVGKKKGYQIEELGSLKNLKGRLEIGHLERVRDKEEALKANIFQNPHLFDLQFEWKDGREDERNDECVLEGLQPHANANLKKLAIDGFQGKRFPSWSEKMAVRDGPQGSWIPLHNLIQITLRDCSEIEEIPTLEHLPNLKTLCLWRLKKVRFINSSFNNLTFLRIEELEGLECLPEWIFHNNHNLSKLWIIGCPLLRALPDGLDTLNTLDRLIIMDCKNLKSIGNPSGGAQQYQGILRRLSIKGCGELMELPRQMLELWAPTIERLELMGLRSLKNLPMLIDRLTKSSPCLTELSILGVPNFMASDSVQSWGSSSLNELKIDVSVEWSKENSSAIEDTVDGILQGCGNSLTLLKLRSVGNWDWVPQSIQNFNALCCLVLENLGVQELPHWFGNLSSLVELNLFNCKKLRRLPSGNASKCLTNLRWLIIEDCMELRIDSEWHNMPHLTIQVRNSKDGPVTTLPAVEPQKENVAESSLENLGSEPISTSESKLGMEIVIKEYSDMLGGVSSKISAADSNPSSISGHEIKQQFADEIEEEGIVSGEKETEMSISGLYSLHKVEPEYHGDEIEEEGIVSGDSEMEMSMSGLYSSHRVEPGEIQAVNEQQEIELTSSNAERTKHHEENVTGSIYFIEKKLYAVVLEDKHLKLKLDIHIILIEDYPPLSPSSPMNAMLNLVDQNLHKLSPKPDYRNSLIVLLQRNKRLTLIDHSFFNNMPELRFVDLSDTKIKILPSSLFKLSKLKVLLLRNCICLEELPAEIGELKKMEVLDLSGTELYSLPAEISQLELVRRMHLSFYGPDDESEYEHLPPRLISPSSLSKMKGIQSLSISVHPGGPDDESEYEHLPPPLISPSFLSKMKGIQSLSISVHPEDHRWTEVVACIIKDIIKLEMLSSLHFYFSQIEMFQNFIERSHSWNKQSLSKFHFTVGQDVKRIASRVPNEVESLFSQEERCLRYINGKKTSSPLIKTVIIRATAFYLDHHTNIRSLSEFDISSFWSLKFCVVRECPKMQRILDEKNARGAFPCLEYLGIYFIWELRQIWKPPSQTRRLNRIFKKPVPVRNFEALKYLMIKTCPKLRFVFWESMLQCLANLEELVVEDCESLEKIIKEENKNVKYQDNVLPKLGKLVLRYLPELVSLGCDVRMSEEKIRVHGCPKFEEIQAGFQGVGRSSFS